jgi:glycerophosphoryl diester phosphodiesterase
MRSLVSAALLAAATVGAADVAVAAGAPVQIGPRPYFLVDEMSDGPLKQELQACAAGKRVFRPRPSRSATAARPAVPRAHARELRGRRAHGRRHRRVRRDLHQGQGTGLPPRAERPAHHHQHPGHAAGRQVHAALRAGHLRRRRQPADAGRAECRTSDITLAEFKTLRGKMDAANPARAPCRSTWAAPPTGAPTCTRARPAAR